MKKLDIYLQNVRISKTEPFIREGARVLDIGCSGGELFDNISKISSGVGIDPHVEQKTQRNNYTLLPGYFPDALEDDKKFDAVTMLAVIEHIPMEILKKMSIDIDRHLTPGGRLIITVPDPKVDKILDVLMAIKVIDGMDVDEHYGYDISKTEDIFTGSSSMKLIHHSKFQLGLNNLFVFEKQSAS